MNVAEAIVNACVAEGVTLAAGLAGTHIGHLLDAISRREEISLIYARQERVALDIADGFARASGTPAIVFTDSGPAAANLMGGLVNSWGDSTPVLFFAGHVDCGTPASRDTKQIPFLEMFGPVSKWSAMIEDPEHVEELLRRAFMHLRSGRPGPVVLGVPHDVSAMEMKPNSYKPVASQPRLRCGADPASIRKAVELIAGAKRPYLYAGAGVLVSEATPELVALAELLTLPCASTLNGKSAFPEHHPLSLGIGGFARARYNTLPAAEIASHADVILAVGCGFKYEATRTRPGNDVKVIQVDIEPSEINRTQLADIALMGDAKIVLGQMADCAKAVLPAARQTPIDARLAEIATLKRRWAEVCAPLLDSADVPINPFRVTKELCALVRAEDTIILHDAGTVRGTIAHHYTATHPRSFIGFGVQSSMGWSLGAAVGAKKAHPDKLVIAVIGEEALHETAVDIETSVRNDAPVLVLVKNNGHTADRMSGKSQRLSRARFHRPVDIQPLAAALGAKVYRIEQPGELVRVLKSAIADVRGGRTTVVEVMTSRANPSLSRLWET
jgi:thiamine pyrophosphate-dependent acetolactate synthase large subunit-like protein